VGKSTLLNRLVGEKLSIVTRKPQTTRQRILGIATDDAHQVVFVDTPGLLDPRTLLQRSMQEAAERAIVDADVLVVVVDAGYPPSVKAARTIHAPSGIPAIACLNKADRLSPDALAALEREFSAERWCACQATTATTGAGVEQLKTEILSRLPESPPYFPVDDIATAPLRYFVAESIREACFEELAEEVPYSTAVAIEEFRERSDPLYISATIFVEHESQKGIVVGRGGAMIRRIGTRARKSAERLLGRRAYLDIRVKVLANWRKRPVKLRLLGYPISVKEQRK